MTSLSDDTRFIKTLCQWARLSPTAVAHRAKLTPSTILRPYNGTATTRLGLKTLGNLKTAFPDFPGFRTEAPDQIGMLGDRLDPHEKPEELAYIRTVDISYAMGDGAEISQYPATGLIPFNLNFIRSISRDGTESLFIATGTGDSMEPTLLRSDIVMVDTSINRLAQQDMIYALSYAGAGMIKRLRRIKTADGEMIEIRSDNPVVPPMIAIPDDVFIIGRVVWVGRKM